MQGLIRLARQLAALGGLLTLGASCTTHVTVKPLDLPEAHGTRIPASIGVYYTDEFTTHPVREKLMVEYDSIALETDIGPASRSAFGATLDSAFEEVIEVDSANPAELVGGRINVVAVPRILDFDYRQVAGDTFVDVTYELELLHRDGRTLTIRAAGHDATDPGNPLGIELLPTAAPRKIAAAIRSASATLWLRLNSVADEDDWFSALAELEEIDHEESSAKAVAGDGPCVVSLFLEDFGYYDEYQGTMQGVIAFDGGNRHRWLPDASRFVRFELEPGVHVIRYGPAMLVQLLAASADRPLAGFTDSIKVDCRAGDSHTYALRFRSGGELTSDALPPATATRELESRQIVTDADPGGPEL